MSRIIVTNEVRTVTFEFWPAVSLWYVKVNGSLISYQSQFGPVSSQFASLENAIKHAKARGLIPQDFEAESLTKETRIEISA